MTKSDLQSQRGKDTLIEKILEAVRVEINISAPCDHNPYTEYGEDFLVFTRGKNLWRVSVKEVKPRKTKKK